MLKMNNQEKDLGILKDVDLREIFTKEDKEFTPWLNKNVEKLGEVLGIEIIDTKTEFQIGSFYLDILGTLAGTDKKVIIENQIEPTDHGHLGQILTYASGVDASIIIWVAKNFRPEHISVLEWLNKNSREDISFFGVEIKVLKIDNSKPALKFDIVVKPDEWERMTSVSKDISETNLNYLKFFEKLVEHYSKENPSWRPVKPQPGSWLFFGSGKTGFGFSFGFSINKFKIELDIDTGDKVTNESYFEELKKYKNEIERKFGEELNWEKKEDKRVSIIRLCREHKGNINTLTNEEKDKIIDWAVENMSKFTKIMSEYVDKIK